MIEARPDDLATRLRRAEAEVDRRRTADAEKEFRILLDHVDLADPVATGRALTGLATCLFQRGDLESARTEAGKAVSLLAGDLEARLAAWTVLAAAEIYLARYDEGAATCHTALKAAGDGHPLRRAWILRLLGIGHYDTGHPDRAIACYRESLAISRDIGWPKGERMALRRLGEATAALGHDDQALRMLAECAEMFVRSGDVQGEALTSYVLGQIHLRQGDTELALRHFTACHDRLGPDVDPVWRARTRPADRRFADRLAVAPGNALYPGGREAAISRHRRRLRPQIMIMSPALPLSHGRTRAPGGIRTRNLTTFVRGRSIR